MSNMCYDKCNIIRTLLYFYLQCLWRRRDKLLGFSPCGQDAQDTHSRMEEQPIPRFCSKTLGKWGKYHANAWWNCSACFQLHTDIGYKDCFCFWTNEWNGSCLDARTKWNKIMVYFPKHRIEHALQLDSADHHSCKEGLIEVLCLNTIYVYRVRRLL